MWPPSVKGTKSDWIVGRSAVPWLWMCYFLIASFTRNISRLFFQLNSLNELQRDVNISKASHHKAQRPKQTHQNASKNTLCNVFMTLSCLHLTVFHVVCRMMSLEPRRSSACPVSVCQVSTAWKHWSGEAAESVHTSFFTLPRCHARGWIEGVGGQSEDWPASSRPRICRSA